MSHTLSGFYYVKISSNQIASTYCDFSKSSTETGYETFIDVKSSQFISSLLAHFRLEYSWNDAIPKGVSKLRRRNEFSEWNLYCTQNRNLRLLFRGNGLWVRFLKCRWICPSTLLHLQHNGANVAYRESFIGDATINSRATVSVLSTFETEQGGYNHDPPRSRDDRFW